MFVTAQNSIDYFSQTKKNSNGADFKAEFGCQTNYNSNDIQIQTQESALSLDECIKNGLAKSQEIQCEPVIDVLRKLREDQKKTENPRDVTKKIILFLRKTSKEMEKELSSSSSLFDLFDSFEEDESCEEPEATRILSFPLPGAITSAFEKANFSNKPNTKAGKLFKSSMGITTVDWNAKGNFLACGFASLLIFFSSKKFLFF